MVHETVVVDDTFRLEEPHGSGRTRPAWCGPAERFVAEKGRQASDGFAEDAGFLCWGELGDVFVRVAVQAAEDLVRDHLILADSFDLGKSDTDVHFVPAIPNLGDLAWI